MWSEISNAFLNLNGATVEVYEWITSFIAHFTGAYDDLYMLGLQLIHVSKMGPSCHDSI